MATDGGFSSRDVHEMTPERRTWILRRIDKWQKELKKSIDNPS